MRRRPARSRGSAVVETAAILPVFLLVMLGVIEVGRSFWVWNSLRFACDEAARYAIARTAATDADIAAKAEAAVAAVGLTGVTCSVGTSGAVREVSCAAPFLSVLGRFTEEPITLTGAARIVN